MTNAGMRKEGSYTNPEYNSMSLDDNRVKKEYKKNNKLVVTYKW
jgi:hypothetical protein